MENTVEQILAGSVQDDAAQAQQENTQPLSEFMNEQKAQTQPEAPAPKEPGWIKQRIGKAVEKAVAEQGWLGALTGGLSAAAGGITTAVVSAVVMALIFKPGDKR